jgi:ATP-dependent Lon protease
LAHGGREVKGKSMSNTTRSTGTAGASVYPVLPLRDIVVFPGMIVPLFVGREKSVKALEEVMRDDKHILVVTQKNAQDDDPAPDQIYPTGTIATVLQLLKLPDGTVKVLVEGLNRATIDRYLQTEDYFEAEASVLPEPVEDATEIEALARSAQSEFENYVKLNKKISAEVVARRRADRERLQARRHHCQPPGDQDPRKGRSALDVSVLERFQKVIGHMEGEIGVLQVEKRIRSRVKRRWRRRSASTISTSR